VLLSAALSIHSFVSLYAVAIMKLFLYLHIERATLKLESQNKSMYKIGLINKKER